MRASPQKNTKTLRFRALVWLGSIIALLAVLIAVGASWFLYDHTINLLTENLRERLLSISITQAANIDAKDLEVLQAEEDWVKPEWAKVVTQLKKAKDANSDIVFMYIIRKVKSNPAEMEFVADAESINPYANTDDNPTNNVDSNKDGAVEPDGADKLQWPGQPNPDPADHIPEAFEAYNGPLTVAELYEDAYGQVLTGYAPIKDDNGNTVAILATDIKADDFFTVTTQTLYPFLKFIASLIAIIAILAISLILIWKHRAEMLAKLSRELEIANEQQDNLLHFISHEIKGYLTKSEAGFAAIAEGDYGVISDELKTMSKAALTDVRKGVATVMNILDASNLKKGTVTFNKAAFDFRSAVQTIVSEQQAAAHAKNIELEVHIAEGEYKLNGDEEKIREHVIRNLIDNAIRYTPAGTIHVELSDGPSTSLGVNKIRFSVKDSGVGITAEDMNNLFAEGGRGKDSIKVNVHSTGYGLFIAKQVVEAHGGKISAESEGAGRGSRFIVEFPAL